MTRKKGLLRRTKKRPYRAPALKTYGDLRTLTKGKGGARNDGGGRPKTRNSGPM
jgi:hypothetical protein